MMKNKKNRPTGLTYNKKSDCIDIDLIKSVYKQSGSKSETKEKIAMLYNVSPITIHRIMKKAGLIRNYNYKN